METELILTNPPSRKEDLTIEELRAYPGKANLTDGEATHIINSLKELSILLFYYAGKAEKESHINDNQSIIRKLVPKKAA